MTSPAFSIARATIKPDVVARSVGDETILLDLETGTYFTLNAVGAVVWKALEAKTGLDAIVDEVLDRFEVDEATARADIDEYLAALVAEGLVSA